MSFHSPKKFFDRTMSALAISQIVSRVPNAARQIPPRLKVTSQTVDNWISGRTMPTALNLVALMTEFEEVTTAVLRLAGKRTLTDSQMHAAKAALQILAGAGDDTSP